MSKRVLTGIIIIFVTSAAYAKNTPAYIVSLILLLLLLLIARAHTLTIHAVAAAAVVPVGCCWLSSLVLFRRPAHYRLTDRTRRAGRQAGRRRGGGRYEGCTVTTTTPPPPPPPTAVSNVAAAAANDAAAAAAPLLVYSVPSSSTRHRHTTHACTARMQQAIDTLVSGPTRTRAHVQAPAPAHPHAHESVVPTFTAAVVHNHLGGKESRESLQNPPLTRQELQRPEPEAATSTAVARFVRTRGNTQTADGAEEILGRRKTRVPKISKPT